MSNLIALGAKLKAHFKSLAKQLKIIEHTETTWFFLNINMNKTDRNIIS